MPATTTTTRTLRLYREGAALKVTITADGVDTAYAVDPSRNGLCWWNAKEQRVYDVKCVGCRAVSCTCPAGRFGKPCRHVAASNKLIDLGAVDADGYPEGWNHTTEG